MAASGTFYPAASGDDGRIINTIFDNADNNFSFGNYDGDIYSCYVRFNSVAIPVGATITSAYVKFTSFADRSDVTCNANIYFNNADNAVAPTSYSEFNALSLTDAVAWNALAGWTDGTQYDTPSLVGILQNVIDRPGWARDSAIQIIIKNNSSSTDAHRTPSSIDYDGGSEKAELHVEWVVNAPTSESASVSDAVGDNIGDLDESAGVSDTVGDNIGNIDESASVADALGVNVQYGAPVAESASVSDEVGAGIQYTQAVPESVSVDDTLGVNVIYQEIINESLGAADTLSFQRILTNSEGVFGYDVMAAHRIETLQESLGAVDAVQIQLHVLLVEYLTAKDTITSKWVGVESLSESLVAKDAISIIELITETIQEALTLTDAITPVLGLLISEYLKIKDAVTGGCTFNKEINESLVATDAIIEARILSLAESLQLVDLHTLIKTLDETLDERLVLADLITGSVTYYKTLNESLVATDTIQDTWILNLAESLTATDAHQLLLALQLNESIQIAEALTASAAFMNTLTESLKAEDEIQDGWILNILESLTAEDAATLTLALLLEETVTIVEVLSSSAAFTNTLQEALTAKDTITHGTILSLAESLVFTDISELINKIIETLSESITAVDTITGNLGIILTLSESIVIVDTNSTLGKFTHVLQEGFQLNVSVTLDGEVYECYVLNTPKFLPSVYSGFGFNSYCVFQGRAFALNSTVGVMELTGDTDNTAEIHSGVLLHKTDFGITNKKRFRKAYLGVSGDDAVMIMEETDGGERKVYTIDDKGMVNASRAVAGKNWELSVSDFDELDTAKLIPVILARRK